MATSTIVSPSVTGHGDEPGSLDVTEQMRVPPSDTDTLPSLTNVIAMSSVSPLAKKISESARSPPCEPLSLAVGGAGASALSENRRNEAAGDGVGFALVGCSSGLDAVAARLGAAIRPLNALLPAAAALFGAAVAPTCATCAAGETAAWRSRPGRSPEDPVRSASPTAPASAAQDAPRTPRQSRDARRRFRRFSGRTGACIEGRPSSSTTSLWRTRPAGVKGGETGGFGRRG